MVAAVQVGEVKVKIGDLSKAVKASVAGWHNQYAGIGSFTKDGLRGLRDMALIPKPLSDIDLTFLLAEARPGRLCVLWNPHGPPVYGRVRVVLGGRSYNTNYGITFDSIHIEIVLADGGVIDVRSTEVCFLP